MNNKLKLKLVISGSLAALFFALYTQKIWGLVPCELCIWQRFVYAGVIFFAIFALIPGYFGAKQSPGLFGFSVKVLLAAQVALAFYHTGIELKWWEGFSSCSSSIGGGSLDEIRAKLMASPLVRCDEAQWKFIGLSMAAWNVVYAFLLLVISFWPVRRTEPQVGV